MAAPNPPAPDSSHFATKADADAVDAIFGLASGFAETARTSAAARLLSLLDVAPDECGTDSALVDVTFARVLRAERRDLAGRIIGRRAAPALSERSAEALDEALGTTDLRSDVLDERAARAAAVCALLDTGLDAPELGEREALVSATLSRIQRDIESGRSRFRLDPEVEAGATPNRGGLRLADLVSIAAVFLIATGIAWPMLVSAREEAREAQCAANLSRAALGFTLYAGDNRGKLPRAEAGLVGGRWWNVGDDAQSHSANLYTLVRRGYASLSDLSCPGNPQAPIRALDPDARDWRTPEEVSFSYQLFAARTPRWGQQPRMVILADRSPVVERSRRGELFDAEATSPNHLGWGQSFLFGDGSVTFSVRPVLENGDNVWLPASLKDDRRRLTGRELPANEHDAFVGP